MRNWERAVAAVAKLGLNGANKEVASHWLSRWNNDKPPSRGAFDLNGIWEHKPAIAIFQIHEGQSLHCVLAGSFHRLALGYELAGQDVLAITSAAERESRLAWCWKIVEGAVTVSYRTYKSDEHPGGTAQGISLPFSNEASDGGRYFLMHTNRRPVNSDWIEGNVKADAQTPAEKLIVSFKEPVVVHAAA